ncbi:hypothetical protein [Acinetobacter soli]|uniref:hypothetical protein n=1 Tax=Acinetobacter soli TaxID=487316 RepID=UPI00148F37CF|nr:hypothetical protein [Acinetobacter soli]
MNFKDLALGVLVLPFLLPIMIISSYRDKKAIRKNLNNSIQRNEKLQTSSDKINIEANN